jgi:hypothetical protein
MIGNNKILLSTFDLPDFLPNHPKRKEIIDFIVDEYWKEWRNKLKTSNKPFIKVSGIGYFELDFSKSKKRLEDITSQLRRIKRKYPDKIEDPTTRIGAIYKLLQDEFRIIWKQRDVMKVKRQKEIIRWNKKYRQKNQLDKIIANYEWIYERMDGNNQEGNS